MEQFSDLSQYINAIASIKTIRDKWKPFNRIAFRRPALGAVGDIYPYHDDLKKAALVYMAHGNEFWSTVLYVEFQKMLQKLQV